MTPRSNKADVRNPLLKLPAARRLLKLHPEAKLALRHVLLDLGKDARRRAEKAWRTHKAPMAAYWKAVSVYANHTARVVGMDAKEAFRVVKASSERLQYHPMTVLDEAGRPDPAAKPNLRALWEVEYGVPTVQDRRIVADIARTYIADETGSAVSGSAAALEAIGEAT